MPRRSNAELTESTRASLLARATEAFAAHGYADAPLDGLVRAAGLTKGALYHHFGSKQGLFEAVLADLDAQVTRQVAAAVAAAPRTRAALVAAARAWFEAMLDAGVRRILLLDAPAVLGHRVMRELDAEGAVRPLVALLVDLQRAGQIATDLDAEPLAHLLVGALGEAALWIGEAPDPRYRLDAAIATVERLLAGLAHSAEGPRKRSSARP